MDSVQKMLKAACEDSGNVDFYNGYSGRGMYGTKCVGLTGSFTSCMNIVGEVLKQMTQELFSTAIDSTDGEENAAYDLNDKVQEAIDKLTDMSYDSMGLDMIVYFPALEQLADEDDLPTDDDIDSMDEGDLTEWIAKYADKYQGDDDDVESLSAMRATAKMMRDRIVEDNG